MLGANFVLTKPLQKNSLQNAINEFHHQFEINRLQSVHSRQSTETSNSNVTMLTRPPKNKLPLTEEEISRSPLLEGDKLEGNEKLKCINNLVDELETEIDELIALFSDDKPDDLSRTLKAVIAIASKHEMYEVLELAISAAQTTEQHIMPEAELLQQLINRLMVNSHQATRLIHKLNQQRKTG